MELASLFCLLLMLIAVCDVAARRLHIPVPVIMVLVGVGVSLIPELPALKIESDLLLLIFLPPLLFPAAFFTSWRDFRSQLFAIGIHAFGLVLVTMAVVVFVAHWLFPSLSMATLLLLGAIVSPSDAVTAHSVFKRLHVPGRIATIVEGESLVNDSLALVVYRFGLAGILSGGVDVSAAAWEVPLVTVGGIAMGLLVGRVVHVLLRQIDDSPLQITISLLTPFVAYLPAEQLGGSGVLAVVTAGIYLGWRVPEMFSARTRLDSSAFWKMLTYLLNGVIFIFIGLQVPVVMQSLRDHQPEHLLAKAFLLSLAVIGVRLIWIFPATRLAALLSRRKGPDDVTPNWREQIVIGWSGMRGGVSLAIALALPTTLADGRPFEERGLLLIITFVVIVATLVVQGLTLPALIRFLRIEPDRRPEQDERFARLTANQTALAYLEKVTPADPSEKDRIAFLRSQYVERIAQLESEADVSIFEGHPAANSQSLALGAIRQERAAVIGLRNSGRINDDTLRVIQRDLDLVEARLSEMSGPEAPGTRKVISVEIPV